MDLKELRDRALQRVKTKVLDLKRGASWAKRHDRTKEGERIRETYQKVKNSNFGLPL